MKKALVISGGGCKGAFAVGAIEYLLDLGYEFDIIVGTSTGALIAPLVGSGRFATAKEIYSNVRTRQLIRKYCCLTLPWRSALYCDKGLKRIVEDRYTEDIHRDLNETDTMVNICTVDLNTGNLCYWDPKKVSRDVFMRALRASSNQPGVMPAVQIQLGGSYHVDGGVREIAPIQKAIEEGAKEVVAIVLEPDHIKCTSEKYNRIPRTLLRSLDLMFFETRKNDIAVGRMSSNIKFTLIRPEKQLTDNSLRFDPVEMRRMIKLGYAKAKEVVPK